MQNKSGAPSEDNLAALCIGGGGGGSGDQGAWHRGQDDSALHGRHLPPSPRKRASSSCAAGSLFSLQEESGARPPDDDDGDGADPPACPSEPGVQGAPPAAAQTEAGRADHEETRIQAPDDPLASSLGRRPSSSSVPWEKGGPGAPEAPADRDLSALCPPDGDVPGRGSASGNRASSVKN